MDRFHALFRIAFKLWKQVGQADVSRSEQPWHVLCDIYAKLLGLVMSHWLMIVGCWHLPSRSMVKAINAIRSDCVGGASTGWQWRPDAGA